MKNEPGKSSKKKNNPKSSPQKKGRRSNAFIRFSGMAFQMAAIIGFGVWAGIKIDEWAGTEKPIYTVIFSLVSVAAAVYFTIKDLSKL